jgi:thiol-disulfide isomerase/thioredoxin
LLDSYSASGKISEDGYSLIKHSLYYQYLGELLFPYKAWTSIEQVQTNSKVVPAYYKKHLRDVLTEFDKPDMMASMFYRRFIIQYARFLLVEDSGIENINVASQLSYYRNTYSDFRKEPLLYDEVCLFYQASGDRAPILEVLNAIKNEDMRGTLDSLSRETKVEFSQQALTFLLEKSDGTLTSLAQILNENKGYVLYLDFWASWCRPCLAEMPNADELSKEFSDGLVKFIYFSVDETRDRWLAKLNFLPRGNHVQSYRMLNAEDFLREMNIRAIPKYILMGEKGNMILFNAPRPGTMEIRSLITENLKQR